MMKIFQTSLLKRFVFSLPWWRFFAKRILSSSATSRKRRLTVARCIANVVVVVVIDVVVIDVVGVFRDVVGVVLIILWHVGSVSYTSSLKKWSSSNPFWQTLHLSFPLSLSHTHTLSYLPLAPWSTQNISAWVTTNARNLK